ncbi:MAG: MFS transporter [Nitrospinota bacterium]|nr:MAG: MFS transporter [Nitrospinota bacterium]
METRPQKRGAFVLLSIAHFFNDAASSFLSPLLPLLVQKLHLSLTLAGSLASFYSLNSSFLQPVAGMIADNLQGRYFILGGPLIAIGFMSLLGLVPSYPVAVLCVLLAGIGSAMFHPQAVSTAGALVKEQRGFGISLFLLGGNLGMALGPVYIISVVSLVGLQRAWIAALPGIITVALLYLFFPKTAGGGGKGQVMRIKEAFLPHWKPLLLLSFLVILRSLIQQGMNTFLPLLLTTQGRSLFAGGLALSLFSLAGAGGGLLGGYGSDRWGRRTIIILSNLCITPFLFGFFQSQGLLSMIFLALAGMAVKATNPVVVAFAQELVPERAGTASSLVMGFSWGFAGIALTGLGKLADILGIAHALQLLMLLPLVAVLAACFLPRTARETEKVLTQR